MLRRLMLGTAACLLATPLVAGCGGTDARGGEAGEPTASPTSVTPTASPTAAGSAMLDSPASKYTLLLADVGEGYFTDRQHTFSLDIDNYSATPTFPNPGEGRKLLKQWGYIEGFETAYEPEGRQTDVLNGKYYIAVETHLFATDEGARAAFTYFGERLEGAGRASPVETQPLGDESSAWKAAGENILGSSVTGTFHRFILRRGNMVAVVQTWGAEPFMRVDMVRGLAAILDDKALGRKDAPEPTPISD